MVSDFRSYLTTIKKTITETSPADLKKWMDKKDEFVLVDVREKEEQKNGVIPGAHLIPRSFLEMKIEDLEARRDRKIVLYCAGVGTIGIIDNDVVDQSNLQRQILHNEQTVGMPKVESATQTLNALNPDVKVVAHNTRL